MVQCACGKAIPRVPSWLGAVNVEFVCNNCPNRTIKSISDVKLPSSEVPEEPMLADGALDDPDEDEVEDEAVEEA
jgi:hypothetical protein